MTNNVSFNNYVVKIGNTIITPNTDGLYELGNLAAAGTTALSICANTNSCALDSIKAESGWSCAAYPTGAELSGYDCWKTLWLKANPLLSQIQLTVEKQPASPIALCTDDTVIFKISSALANYADNPEFRVTILPGMFVNSGEIEYPDGSGIWQTVVPEILNGILTYKVEAHTGVSDAGLPGTISNPGTANRAARLRLNYSTTCGFKSGSKISVQQRADRPCGDPIPTNLGYNNTVRANPINITGAAATGNLSFNLSLTSTLINCGNISTLSGNVVPAGAATSTADTILVTLPTGVIYAGNFTSAGGISLVPGYPVAGPGGSQILKLKVPAGIATGTPLNYSCDLTTTSTFSGCGNFSIVSEAERTNAPISCGATLCTDASKSIIGSAENIITVVKPDLSIVDLDYVSGDFSAGGTTTVTITVANTADIDASASGYVVEFFCGSNTAPFASSLFPPVIPALGSATASLTISVPASPACVNGEIVTAKIRPVTETNQEQCLCKEASREILRALPVTLTDFTARQQNCKTTLSWHSQTEVNFKGFEVQYSVNGQSYNTISKVEAKGDNAYYTYSHQPAEGRVYYRLLLVDKDGGKKYSSILTMNATCAGKNVTVYPNPAFSLLNVNLSGYSGGIVTAKLYNGTGQLVLSKLLQNGINTINVNQLARGTYALVVTDQKGNQQAFKIYISH